MPDSFSSTSVPIESSNQSGSSVMISLDTVMRPHKDYPLQFVRLPHQVHSQILHHFERLGLIQPMLCDQPCQERAINSTRHIMPRRNRQKRPSIVVKPNRVVEA